MIFSIYTFFFWRTYYLFFAIIAWIVLDTFYHLLKLKAFIIFAQAATIAIIERTTAAFPEVIQTAFRLFGVIGLRQFFPRFHDDFLLDVS